MFTEAVGLLIFQVIVPSNLLPLLQPAQSNIENEIDTKPGGQHPPAEPLHAAKPSVGNDLAADGTAEQDSERDDAEQHAGAHADLVEMRDVRDAGGQDARDGAGRETVDDGEHDRCGGARSRQPQAQHDQRGQQRHGQEDGEFAEPVGVEGRDGAAEGAGRVEDGDQVFL